MNCGHDKRSAAAKLGWERRKKREMQAVRQRNPLMAAIADCYGSQYISHRVEMEGEKRK